MQKGEVMSKIKMAYSKHTTEKIAVQELSDQLSDMNCKYVLFFTSSCYDPAKLSHSFNNIFPMATVFGCSGAGELVSGYMLQDSIVAMGISDDVFEDLYIEILNLRKFNSKLMRDSIHNFKEYYSVPLNQMDRNKYFGIVLADGLSIETERVLDELGEYSNLSFIGGSAGSTMNMQPVVFANRTYYYNTVLIALIKSKLKIGFEIIQNIEFFNDEKHTSFIATEVDEDNRIIYKLDDKPALEAFAEALDITPEEVFDASKKHPLCSYIENMQFIKSISSIVAKGGLKCYSTTKKGTKLYITNTFDILEHTRNYVNDLPEKYENNILGMVIFNCFERFMLLQTDKDREEYGNIFEKIPTIGCDTFGESFIGFNNLSATVLVIEDKEI